MTWFSRRFTEPNRQQVLTAIRNLPELPEHERMRTKPMETRKPQSLEEWRQKYGRVA